MSLHVGDVDQLPTWYKYCVAASVPERMLSSILNSYVGSFAPSAPRAGVFRDIFTPHNEQPNVLFYVQRGVPVWYRWGPEQRERAMANKLIYWQMVPPQETIEASRQCVWGVDEMWEADQWQKFFDSRAQTYAKYPGTRRQRNQPTSRRSGIKVFHWVVQAGVLVRKAVDPRFVSSILQQFPESQKRYDGRANEWDICSFFGGCQDPADEDGTQPSEKTKPCHSRMSPLPTRNGLDLPPTFHPAPFTLQRAQSQTGAGRELCASLA
ncbi:hypothetical protein B0H10DRAFT_2028125 [Mycena sp. CBHHK59/15]|nr:hypothetical protein B0H10DRAFT_2028125 [Mycena sp. CBHHK59/15]